jgi:hypothetical protein
MNTPNQNVSKSKKGFGASPWTSITRPFTKYKDTNKEEKPTDDREERKSRRLKYWGKASTKSNRKKKKTKSMLSSFLKTGKKAGEKI